MSHRPSLAICIPAKNERENLAVLLPEIDAMLGEVAAGKVSVVVFDDGSTDGTYEYLRDLEFSRFTLQLVQSLVSVGKSAGLANAFDVALELESDVIVMMDGDCQDNPWELPGFLEVLAAGNDLAHGRRINREGGLEKRLASRAFNGLVRQITGLRIWDINSGYKAFTRSAALAIRPYFYGELHRVILVIAVWSGLRVGEVRIMNRPRKAGRSRYGIARAWRGLFDLITIQFLRRYHARPSHFFTGVGAALAGLGGLSLLGLGVIGLTQNTWAVGSSVAIIAVAFLGFGLVFWGFGFVAELLVFSSRGPIFSFIRRANVDHLLADSTSVKSPGPAEPGASTAPDANR